MPLRHALDHHARQRPDALAVAICDTRLTYGALFERLKKLHAALTKLPLQARPDLPLPDGARNFALSIGNHPEAPTLLAAALADGSIESDDEELRREGSIAPQKVPESSDTIKLIRRATWVPRPMPGRLTT